MKWEYRLETMKFMKFGSETALLGETDLNAIGEEGWEAVSMWHTEQAPLDEHGNDTVVLFKRPISK